MKQVTISKDAFDCLIKSQDKLLALEAHGVDNWQGYDDAMEDIYGEDE